MAKQVLVVQIEYDDEVFAARPPDMTHCVRIGLAYQYGNLQEANIVVNGQYDSTQDPNWAKVRDR